MDKKQCPVCLRAFTPNYAGRVCCSDQCAKRKLGTFLQRFWNRVSAVQSGCWEWVGKIERGGYARVRLENSRERVLVHRLSWEMKNGPIPEGMLILHKCDNRKCVNPDHLYVGTYQNNTDDMLERGRANKARGERHGRAKLTDDQFHQLVSDYNAGGVTQKQLASKYGLHPIYVNKLLRGHKRQG